MKLAGRHSATTSDAAATPSERSPKQSLARYWPLGSWCWRGCGSSIREPEALFWVYGFPILMTIGAGHRVSQSAGRADRGRRRRRAPRPEATAEALRIGQHRTVQGHEIVSTATKRGTRLRTGKTDLVVYRATAPTATRRPATNIRFDPTRPQSVLARSAVDDQLQRAAGRSDVAEVKRRSKSTSRAGGTSTFWCRACWA